MYILFFTLKKCVFIGVRLNEYRVVTVPTVYDWLPMAPYRGLMARRPETSVATTGFSPPRASTPFVPTTNGEGLGVKRLLLLDHRIRPTFVLN